MLAKPRNTIEIINKYSFVFQKKYGQNFLIDTHVLEMIVRTADISKDDFVLEIGPGIGSLTQYLCESAREVVAVEIDKRLIPILEDTLSAYDNITILNEDILKFDIEGLVKNYNNNSLLRWLQICHTILQHQLLWTCLKTYSLAGVTIMIQREVADRIQARPGTRNTALSLAVQYYAKPYIAANVPPNCFMPRPKVGSAVINLTPNKESPYQVKVEYLLFSLIRASFNQRRKTLVNGIYNFEGLSFSKEEIVEALEFLELSKDIRGETMTLGQFVEMANYLSKYI